MGLLADFFLARSDADAMRYPDGITVFERWKGFTTVELSILYSLIQGVDWDESMLDAFPCILEIDDGNQTTVRFPENLPASLAVLNADETHELGIRWSACEEFAWDDKPQAVQDCLAAICRLAMQAQHDDGARLYLWNSA